MTGWGDVPDGKNPLVINGSPDTGKSRTMTNIVAPAMAEGKKILFVSEKVAALNGVKQRLENDLVPQSSIGWMWQIRFGLRFAGSFLSECFGRSR